MSRPRLSPTLCGQIACTLEATARKPGNVHPSAEFADLTYLDFLLSALSSMPVLNEARRRGVGPTVLDGVRRTREVVAGNSNLGILLLLAPLAAVPRGEDLRDGVVDVLQRTTVFDAEMVYEAIRLAQPGGLGEAEEGDVSGKPTGTLREMMGLAAERDGVAAQYWYGYRDVFAVGLPALKAAWAEGRSFEVSIVLCHLHLMARCPDTLIARKRGAVEAAESARRAADVLAAGWPATPAGKERFSELDAWLRAEGHQRNPGTTADLVSACLFVALWDGTIPLPLAAGRWAADRGAKTTVPEQYHVRVTKDSLVFCSGHFITYEGHQCERLHGHNYRTSVELEADLDENYYVFDFIALKRITRQIIEEIDHRMLLPTRNRLISVDADERRVQVRYKDREWVFPRDDCVLLPIENTTAEMIATWIAGRLREELGRVGGSRARALRVEVEESFGQSATYQWRAE